MAEALGLSRMPVRNALARLRLRLQGLVTVRPRKGIEVRRIDPAELLQIIEVSTVNECHAVRLAAHRFSAEDVTALDKVLDDTAAALSGTTPRPRCCWTTPSIARSPAPLATRCSSTS